MEGGEKVGAALAGGGLEATFGEGTGIEGGSYSGRGGGREDFGVYCGVLDVVEGEACPVWGFVRVIEYGAQVAGGNAGLEDQGSVGLGDAAAVVEDGKGSVSAVFQGGGDEDVSG